MTPLRIAVIDDEPLARAGVLARLQRHANLLVVAEFGDGANARAGIAALHPDLLFLDVQMPGLSGLELLAAMPAQQRPVTILLTAHSQFALRAFELQVIDYLLKPIDDSRFDEALARARNAVQAKRLGPSMTATATATAAALPLRFEARVGTRTVFVDADSIDWIGAEGDYAALHVGARSCLVRESLQQLAARLDPRVFVRIHRSYIVRVDRVVELQALSNRDAMLRLADGTPLRASRTHMPALLEALRGPGAAATTGSPTPGHGSAQD